MKTKDKASPDIYMALIQAYPLKPIRTPTEHAAAMAVASPMLRRDESLDADELAYLDVLLTLIQQYEQKTLPRAASTPHERLRFIVGESGITQTKLAHVLGVGQPAASLILSGKRNLTTEGVRRLAEHFKLSPAYFI